MENKMGFINYAQRIINKRRSRKSCCGFLLSSDELRISQIEKDFRNQPEIIIVTYDYWKGLRHLPNEQYDVAEKKEGMPPHTAFREFESIVEAYVKGELVKDDKKQFEDGREYLLIVKGLVKQDDVLTSFINSNVIEETFIGSDVATVLIATDNMGLFPASLVNKCWVIEPENSARQERETILKSILEHPELTHMGDLREDENFIQSIVDVTAGLNLNFSQSAILESIIKYGEVSATKLIEIKKDMLQSIKGIEFIPESVIQNLNFDMIGGYDWLKKYFKENIMLVYEKPPELVAELGVTAPRGILMFGDGGTGKSYFAKCLAGQMDMMFIRLIMDEISSKWHGESEENFREAIKLINEMGSRVIVFIDEIDRLGNRESSFGNDASRQIFGKLLEWLGDEDERQCIVIGATNRMDLLDEQFQRDGRFDKKIFVDLPDTDAREQIFEIHASKVGRKLDYETLAKMTPYYTGANIKEVCSHARRIALSNDRGYVTMKDLTYCIQDKVINEARRKEREQKYMKMAKDFCDSKEILRVRKKGTGTKNGGDGDSRLKGLKLGKN